MTPAADYRHAYRVFLVLLIAIAVGLALRQAAVPRTFGETGHFRAAAPSEIAAREPRHQTQAVCVRCHAKQATLHDKDAHAHVPCEDCHGPGLAHVKQPAAAKMQVPAGKDVCLACHRQLPARASFFPQIEPAQHFRSLGVTVSEVACTRCHDPHEPLFMDRDLRTARLHPLVHRCRDCHTGSSRDPRTPRPAGHPAIFECSYCHKAIAADHAQRNHKRVACTTCHLFFKESEFAGRIIRDADPRFCLLCHRKTDFRGGKAAPPSIEWPAHREDMGGDKAAVCVDCHLENIHKVDTPVGDAPVARTARDKTPGGKSHD